MVIFQATNSKSIKTQGCQYNFVAGQKYVSTQTEVKHYSESGLRGEVLPNTLPEITWKANPATNVAILNGMSLAYGDHLIGCTALRLKQRQSPATRYTLYQINPEPLQPITRQFSVGKAYLPTKLELLEQHDGIVNLGGIISRPQFNTLNMFDFFLEALGIKHETIPDGEKVPIYNVPPYIENKIKKQLGSKTTKPICLLHTASTTPIRSIPENIAKDIYSELEKKFFVVSVDNNKHCDLNIKGQPDFDHLAAVVKNVDAVFSIDTSVIHLAAAFEKPTVALFTTIQPDLRIKYYPYCKGFFLGASQFAGMHKIRPETFEKVKHKYEALWDNFNIKETICTLMN